MDPGAVVITFASTLVMSVTTAPTMPVAVANTVQVTSVATASEPGTRAMARCMLLNSFSIRLARSTR